MYTSTRAIVAITVVALAATACSSSGEGEANKAGGSGTPIVLKVGTDDFPPRPAAAQIEEFGRRVAELSDDFIRIEPVWRAGDDEPDWDQVVARKVMDGTLDMANVPTRAWDVEGVTSLRALNAPFLITSDALLDEVVTSDLADEMIAGLEDAGVVGLALLPESLRHPFGFDGPLLGPDDYVDGSVRAPLSETTELMFSALGGSRTGAEKDFETQIGMESAYHFDVDGPATGNVTFYPKVNVLAINADTYGGLTDDQRSILEQAAGETLDWAIENRPEDLEAAAGFCDEGGTIVLASDADLAALEQSVQPVYDELEADPQSKAHIEAIRQLKQSLPPTTLPEPCGDDLGAGSGGEPPADTPENSAINGIYRVEYTQEAFDAAGVPRHQSEPMLGVWTVVLQDGTFIYEEEMHEESEPQAHYTIDGDLVTFTFRGDGSDIETFRWELTDKGDLELALVDAPAEWRAFAEVWGAGPWIRVGEVDSLNSAINGVYRWELTEPGFRAANVPNEQIEGNVGVWTNTFKDGQWWDDDGWMGSYELDGDEITVTHKDGVVETYRWRLTESGDLDLYEIVHLSDEEWRNFNVYWISQPWVRVGDA